MIAGISIGMVAAGGALGTVLRAVLVGRLVPFTVTLGFPLGILVVNVVGSFLMGILVGFLMRTGDGSYSQGVLYLFFATGFLGGFTTFSAFALDVVMMLQRGQHAHVALYITLSVGLCIAAVLGGLAITRPKVGF